MERVAIVCATLMPLLRTAIAIGEPHELGKILSALRMSTMHRNRDMKLLDVVLFEYRRLSSISAGV